MSSLNTDAPGRADTRMVLAALQSLLNAESWLTVSQAAVLFLVQANPRISPSQIGDELGLPRATTSNILGVLEKTGWVTVSLDKHDRRARCVEVAPKGKRVVASALEAAQPFVVLAAGKVAA